MNFGNLIVRSYDLIGDIGERASTKIAEDLKFSDIACGEDQIGKSVTIDIAECDRAAVKRAVIIIADGNGVGVEPLGVPGEAKQTPGTRSTPGDLKSTGAVEICNENATDAIVREGIDFGFRNAYRFHRS